MERAENEHARVSWTAMVQDTPEDQAEAEAFHREVYERTGVSPAIADVPKSLYRRLADKAKSYIAKAKEAKSRVSKKFEKPKKYIVNGLANNERLFKSIFAFARLAINGSVASYAFTSQYAGGVVPTWLGLALGMAAGMGSGYINLRPEAYTKYVWAPAPEKPFIGIGKLRYTFNIKTLDLARKFFPKIKQETVNKLAGLFRYNLIASLFILTPIITFWLVPQILGAASGWFPDVSSLKALSDSVPSAIPYAKSFFAGLGALIITYAAGTWGQFSWEDGNAAAYNADMKAAKSETQRNWVKVRTAFMLLAVSALQTGTTMFSLGDHKLASWVFLGVLGAAGTAYTLRQTKRARAQNKTVLKMKKGQVRELGPCEQSLEAG